MDLTSLVEGIRNLAKDAILSPGISQHTAAYHLALQRDNNPCDYMRYAEFNAVLQLLHGHVPKRILDVGSPQWFSLFFAKAHPATNIDYINILRSELDPYEEIARACNVRNIKYLEGDVRKLEIPPCQYDLILSISVIEHVAPGDGGDRQAFKELHRVIKPDGEFILTVPYKNERNIVYCYERGQTTSAPVFFAREYDREMFKELITSSNFSMKEKFFICEKRGLLSLDYYEWGPGKDRWYARYPLGLKRRLERYLSQSVEQRLADRYLRVQTEEKNRVVNIACSLAPKS